MTPDELHARQVELNLLDRELSAAKGVSLRTLERWKDGTLDIPRDMRQWLDEYEKGRELR